MPSVFKQQGFVSAEGCVKIPDIAPCTPLAAEPLAQDGQAAEGELVPAQASAYTAPRAPTREEIALLYPRELQNAYTQATAEGFAKGMEEGLNRKKGELRACVNEVSQRLDEMQSLQQRYMNRYAEELKFLAIEIAEKMILQKIEEDDLVLQRLVLQMVANVKNANWLKVEISDNLTHLVDFLKQELEKPEYHGRAELCPTACPDDTCRVSTEAGTTVGTISTQAQNLHTVFEAAQAEAAQQE